jgi:hypothetical protein
MQTDDIVHINDNGLRVWAKDDDGKSIAEASTLRDLLPRVVHIL